MSRKVGYDYDYHDDYNDDDYDYYSHSQDEDSVLEQYKPTVSSSKPKSNKNVTVPPQPAKIKNNEKFVKDDDAPRSGSFKIRDTTESAVNPQITQLRNLEKDIGELTLRPDSEPSAQVPRVSSILKLSAVETAITTNTTCKPQQRPVDSKPSINFVVVGHVDAGKSTLMGHMLYLLGYVSKKTVMKYKQEAQKMGKSSFYYAWILDETDEERIRGVTVDIARACFETETRKYHILDAPGHRDFIPNMITGASQSDAALLVICATRGEFESGFDFGGQTREHALLIRALGVSNIVVAINKMDTIEWDKNRFDEIIAKLNTFLTRQAGFTKTNFIPVSAITGENLVKPFPLGHPLKKWYNGPTLIEALENLPAVERLENAPLRIVVNDVLKSTPTLLGLSAKVEAGHIQVGDKVFIMPRADFVTVKGVCIDEHDGAAPPTLASKSSVCFAGDQILITLTGNFESDAITTGNVICRGGADCLIPVQRFTARIVVFDVPIPIIRGTKAELFCHSLCAPCTVKMLKCTLDKATGEILKNKPRCLPKNSTALIVLETDVPVSIEAYSKCRPLGRISLRSNNITIAAGIIDTTQTVINEIVGQ